MWEGGKEKGEKRKTTAAWKKIQHCQVKATVTGSIYFLAEGFPVSSVAQRREKKNHIILKNIDHESKISRRGASLRCCSQEITPRRVLRQKRSLAQHKTAPHKTLLWALACCKARACYSKDLQTSKPHCWARVCPRDKGSVCHRLHFHPLPTNPETRLETPCAWHVDDLSFYQEEPSAWSCHAGTAQHNDHSSSSDLAADMQCLCHEVLPEGRAGRSRCLVGYRWPHSSHPQSEGDRDNSSLAALLASLEKALDQPPL